jgi:hypothetical protein
MRWPAFRAFRVKKRETLPARRACTSGTARADAVVVLSTKSATEKQDALP